MPDFAQPLAALVATVPSPADPRLFILAGNVSQATLFMRAFGLQPYRVCYVASENNLRGVLINYWIIVGTFWDRKDAMDIWRCLEVSVARPGNGSGGAPELPMPPLRLQPVAPTPPQVIVVPAVPDDEPEAPIDIRVSKQSKFPKLTTIQRLKKIRDR